MVSENNQFEFLKQNIWTFPFIEISLGLFSNGLRSIFFLLMSEGHSWNIVKYFHILYFYPSDRQHVSPSIFRPTSTFSYYLIYSPKYLFICCFTGYHNYTRCVCSFIKSDFLPPLFSFTVYTSNVRLILTLPLAGGGRKQNCTYLWIT